MAVLEQYSRTDYTDQNLLGEGSLDGDIVGSCFHQTEPDTPVFDAASTVTFRRCNLDNCVIPPGCTVRPSCTHKRLKLQSDKEWWRVSPALKPIEPLDKQSFIDWGISIDPADLPVVPLRKPRRNLVRDALRASAKIAEAIAVTTRTKAMADARPGVVLKTELSIHIQPEEVIRPCLENIRADLYSPSERPKYAIRRNKERGEWEIKRLLDTDTGE